MTSMTATYGPNVSARSGFAITPSDSTRLPESTRMITIGTAGTLSFMNLRGEVQDTNELPAGTYPVQASRIRATGTTAGQITGWS